MKNDNQLKSGDYSTSLNMHVYNEIPADSVCLDMGCWNGNLGEKLIKEKHCKVDGADVNESMLKEAKSKGYGSTYKLNLNSENLDFTGIKNTYDVIIFADVLEHLINPEKVLLLIQQKLKPQGKIIISLPNVAFFLNRILLLLGRWDYREFGTLDKTHLKFYTISSAPKMLESTGLVVTKICPYNQFGMLRYIEPINKLLPGLCSYQILLVAEKPNE